MLLRLVVRMVILLASDWTKHMAHGLHMAPTTHMASMRDCLPHYPTSSPPT